MARIHSVRRSTLSLRERKTRLLRLIKVHPDVLRASFVERFGKCGKPTCACHQGQLHGPFYYLTQCLAVGKVKKFLLKTEPQQQRAKQGVEHYRELLELLEELSQINSELLRRGEPIERSSP